MSGKNVAASVCQRLLNRSRQTGEDFQLLLTRYAIERLLYRLGESEHATGFILKGALLFALWTGELHRPTRDLDLLGFGDSSAGRLAEVFRSLCSAAVPDDGLAFAADTIKVEPIREDQEYGGQRVTLGVRLGTARIDLQIDVGFGDAITPGPELVTYPHSRMTRGNRPPHRGRSGRGGIPCWPTCCAGSWAAITTWKRKSPSDKSPCRSTSCSCRRSRASCPPGTQDPGRAGGVPGRADPAGVQEPLRYPACRRLPDLPGLRLAVSSPESAVAGADPAASAGARPPSDQAVSRRTAARWA